MDHINVYGQAKISISSLLLLWDRIILIKSKMSSIDRSAEWVVLYASVYPTQYWAILNPYLNL